MPLDDGALRGYLARVLGWSDEAAVEKALRSVQLCVARQAPLVLIGDTDLVSIAHAVHRRTVGDGPFVVCDRRRLNTPASVRSPMNRASGVTAIRAASGGSLCLHRARLPADLRALTLLARDPRSAAQVIVCAEAKHALDAFLILTAPIVVPPLASRQSELPRVVDEYASDAIATLGGDASDFTDADRTWVMDHAETLATIATATHRLVALRKAQSCTGAAALLEMSHVALARWIGRRRRGRRS